MSSLGDAVAATCARRGDDVALLSDDQWLSFREVAARARATAAALVGRGVRSGDRVAVGLPNSAELVTTILGVLHAGAVLVPLNPASTAEEVAYVVGDASARLAIVGPGHARALAAARLPTPVGVVEGPLAVDETSVVLPRTDADAPALIVYTSGTTGRPKGAILSHRALLTNFTAVAQAWQWTEQDRLLLTLPCFHLHGLGLGILTSFLVGSSVALRPRFTAADTLGDLQGVGATMFFGVPTMYNRLVALPDAALAAADLSRMRLWVSGSAPLSAATFERFRTRFGVELMDRYGMTECGFVLSTPYGRPRRPGVVGVPLPGVSVRLVEPEAAARGELVDVTDGVQGEIIMRGPNLFSGYWNRPEDTQRALVDGYLLSGDLGVREADGMMRIVGRKSVDIIKTRGFKVSAGEIEDCLQHHPDVQEVAVVGLPDADQGERVVAAVTPSADAATALTADALRMYARQHLAPHKVPSGVVFVAEIPRTGPGKFKKQELIRRLTDRGKG